MQSGSLDGAEEAVIQDQWRAFLLGLASVPGPRWVSSPGAIRAAEDKARQLSLARRLGMEVPETLWTNSLSSARRFLDENGDEMAAKSVTSAWWEREGTGWFVFAGRVQREDLPSASGLAAAPVALQAPIDPKRDVRVTVVGSQVFAAIRVDQASAAGPDAVPLDWRRGSDQPWVPHALPDTTAFRCIELVASLDLRFGAIDLLLDPSGRHWFCEINPNGEWGWLQRSGLPIAEALADHLLDD
jgi:glutathione synthase/RimK-type ligase-like ATP-grasp enzyme